MSERVADGVPSPRRRDPHPELSAPIVDLSLEVQIARAEQAVKDRDARVRAGALRVGEIAKFERGMLIRRAAIVGALGLAAGAGYVGYKAWQRRKPGARRQVGEERQDSAPPRGMFEFAELAGLLQIALQWATRLHQEQGIVGSVFGAVRKALWPERMASAQAPASKDASGPGGPDSSPPGEAGNAFR